jgi:hypothetical protein
VKLTQPVICEMRIAMAPVAAISPGVASPFCHSNTAPSTRITGNSPAVAISTNRNPVER